MANLVLFKRFKRCMTYVTFAFFALLLYTQLQTYFEQYYIQHINLDADSYFENDATLQYPVKVQPNLYLLINASNPRVPLTINAPYLIENHRLCSSVEKLTALIVVNSATDHFERRLAIRSTWTNNTYFSHLATVRVVFLLGRSKGHLVQSAIEKEFDEFGDIVQGDFVDRYYSLTHKSVMGLKWVTERCRNAKMIVKVDDDVIVNMFLYFYRLQNSESLKNANVYCDYKSELISRDVACKWHVDESHFKGVKEFTKFCKGKFVSMTNDIMPSLFLSAKKSPFFHLDDVLLFGYAMNKVSGLKYRAFSDSDWHGNTNEAKHCLETKGVKCEYLVMQASYKEEVEDIWSEIVKHFKRYF